MIISNGRVLPIAINNFSKKYPELDHMGIVRCLYVQEDTHETFVIECEHARRNNTFIFVYDCGELSEIRSEHNTFGLYFSLIPSSRVSEYVNID